MATRALPNILITGTPGTGKTTTSQQVAEECSMTAINIGKLVADHNLHDGWDENYESWIINEDKVVDALEDRIAQGGCLVEHHGCDFFPERWFDLVLVLTTENGILYERLEKRNYSEQKLRGNMECEIMHTLVEEARESYKEEIVKVLPSNGIEDLESNVEHIVQWVKQYAQSRAQ